MGMRRGSPGNVAAGGLTVDRGHPLAQGLVNCVLMGSANGARGLDLMNSRPAVSVGGSSGVMTANGWAPTSSQGLRYSPYGLDASVAALSFTIDAWVMISANASGGILTFGGTGGAEPGEYVIGVGSTDIDVAGTNLRMIEQWVAQWSGGASFTLGRWHHVALVRDGTVPRSYAYFDGRQTATRNDAGTKSTTTNWLRVGHDQSGRYNTNATIQTARLWGRPLSPADIAWLAIERYPMLAQAKRQRWYLLGVGGTPRAWGEIVGMPVGLGA